MVSIIVTHKKDTLYLKDCLESIAEQQFKDYETILVVDHTEDNIEPLIEEFKDKINLKVFYLEDKHGVSSARNLGLDKATGEYVYFLDNDDYLYGDSIKLLLDVMDEDTDMAYGRMKHTWFQKQAFNDSQGDDDDNNDNDADDKKVIYDFNEPYSNMLEKYRKLDKITVLAAIYKKSLFTDNNIRFNEKQTYFSDTKVLVQLLNNAKNIKSNEESVYVKRHHNDKAKNPAISQFTREETMPDYFVAYKNAIKAAGTNERIINHLYYILAKFVVKEYIMKMRWSEDDRWRNEFFTELATLAKDINNKVLKDDFTHAEKAMVKSMKHNDFAKMKKKAMRVLFNRKIVKMIKNPRVRNKTITLYVFNKMKLKENWVVFESFMGRNCSGQPKYVYKYLQEAYGDKYKCIWVVDRKGVEIPGKHKTCKRFSLKYYYYMNRSKYWVNNMRQPLSIPRREETVMLATWHGTPLKRLVFDMDDVHSANPRYKDVVFKQTRAWDYLLSDNPFSTERFQSCFRFEKEKILEYGYPANDPMYAPDREEQAAKIKEKLGIPKDKKVILYAPTWRDDQFYEAGQYGFELDLDVNRLQEEFGDEYVLLLRLHYFIVDQLDLSKYGDFTVDGSSYDDITDLYLISDMLITDYSSVFFDYANLKRPVLYYTYDLDKYRDVLRGFYLDMEKDLPGPLLLTNDEVVDAIKNIDKICALEDDDGYSRAGDWEADMRGTYGRGSSYRGRKRDSMGRYSRDGRMDGYSHHNARESMMELAREMMENTSSEREREAIRRFMTELERD